MYATCPTGLLGTPRSCPAVSALFFTAEELASACRAVLCCGEHAASKPIPALAMTPAMIFLFMLPPLEFVGRNVIENIRNDFPVIRDVLIGGKPFECLIDVLERLHTPVNLISID